MTLLSVCRAHELNHDIESPAWLIEGIWSDQAVGICGGEPKLGKSWLVLGMAVSVASGVPCLGHFRVAQTGPVLYFAAEDGLHIVRKRLDAICAATNVRLSDLDIHVITEPVIRLDHDSDRKRLLATVDKLRPKLLILDPFIRMHRKDENASGDVAPMLAYLRELQRRFSTAIIVVHHAKKGASNTRPGQALRGSSEFHSWGDSNLYLRRKRNELVLSIEHRAAPAGDDVALELWQRRDAIALQVIPSDSLSSSTKLTKPSTIQRIEEAIRASDTPLTFRQLRAVCRIGTTRLSEGISRLSGDGRLRRSPKGYELVPHDNATATATTYALGEP